VEINNTFYRFPEAKTMDKWRSVAPAGFMYSLKVPRFVTHLRKFVDTQAQVSEFYRLAERLGDKLGCLLFQLPGSFKYSPQALERMVAQVDQHYHNVIEFRDESWWREEVYQALQNAKIGFCHVSAPANLPQTLIPGKLFYLRFHGTERWFQGAHSQAELKAWLAKCNNSGADSAWVYFNNTASGDAVNNAKTLQRLFAV
jgi:uncharacterized protein YecE (DUF72 family)